VTSGSFAGGRAFLRVDDDAWRKGPRAYGAAACLHNQASSPCRSQAISPQTSKSVCHCCQLLYSRDAEAAAVSGRAEACGHYEILREVAGDASTRRVRMARKLSRCLAKYPFCCRLTSFRAVHRPSPCSATEIASSWPLPDKRIKNCSRSHTTARCRITHFLRLRLRHA
jgi:hypothetical protein